MRTELKGKKALILGLGKTGVSSAKFLSQNGALVTVMDIKAKSELTEQVKALSEYKIQYECGKHNPKLFKENDIIIVSPGIPSNIEGLSEAIQEGKTVINDIELLGAYTQTPIIAITGSYGKTTTATLITKMLELSGKTVFYGGNNGVPALNYLLENKNQDIIVLELSSYQCENLLKFKPKVALFTNFEPNPNHLSRYPTGIESYYNAKTKLIKNADSDTILITNLDNDFAARLAQGFPGQVFSYTKRNPMNLNPILAENFQGAYLTRPRFTFKMHGKDDKIFSLLHCKMPGDINKENIMAATTAALVMGAGFESCQKIIDTFTGLPHQLEFVKRKDGVYFFNDSKSSTVQSLKTALNAFNIPIILIAGGKDKDQDFSPLAELIKKKVKNLILIGEAKEKINRAIGDYSETFMLGTFEEAVLLAYQKSRNGDVILLSPGCPSYDMFKNYEERGEYFKKLVEQL
jgi:UDP-N-acetylmuramoylalanine--D-glutamate ligase